MSKMLSKENVGKKTRAPSILIDPIVLEQYETYVRLSPGEVSGLGEVVTTADGRLLINKLYLFEQEATATDTTISEETISKFLTDSVRLGANLELLKLWWHSHADMGVFWSGQDDSTIENFKNSWMLSVVANKKGEYLARLDFWEPFRMTLDDCPFFEARFVHPDLQAEWKKEVEEKVKKPSVVSRVVWSQGYQVNDYRQTVFGTGSGEKTGAYDPDDWRARWDATHNDWEAWG